jgi:hypothetical protein
MARKKGNTRKRSGGRKKSVIKIEWDESARRDAGMRTGRQGGFYPTAYRTESGAKGRATKQDGTVIAKEPGSDYVYYWYLDANRTPSNLEIISIYQDGGWKGVSHSTGKVLIGELRDIGGGHLTNISNIDDAVLKKEYLGAYDDQYGYPDMVLLQQLNRELSRATSNRASSTWAGSNEIMDVYYIHYFGRPEDWDRGRYAMPYGQLNRVRSKVVKTAAHLPFVYQPTIGDISGEGDYVTHLAVFKEDARFDS